ncbi:ABC transporter ATP-binding protein [Streptomonospora sediminis]
MIEAINLTKSFGENKAVDDLSFTVSPGRVVGFLGPNGSGKTTTMRMILGLMEPTQGSARVNGRSFRQFTAPMQEVGAVLDPSAIHPAMTARAHLSWLAKAGRISVKRVDEVLETVGLTEVAQRKVGAFSLGMRQRLGLASALLGDPATLLLDEPVNGLDPDGVLWVRNFMRGLAAEGRTVFVSSHLMHEMEETADRVVVIGRGRLIADKDMDEIIQSGSGGHVLVASPQAPLLTTVLTDAGAKVEHDTEKPSEAAEGRVVVRGLDAASIGELAARYNITLHELAPRAVTLEDMFMELTHDSATYTAAPTEGQKSRS